MGYGEAIANSPMARQMNRPGALFVLIEHLDTKWVCLAGLVSGQALYVQISLGVFVVVYKGCIG
jgi:hypothetical protein